MLRWLLHRGFLSGPDLVRENAGQNPGGPLRRARRPDRRDRLPLLGRRALRHRSAALHRRRVRGLDLTRSPLNRQRQQADNDIFGFYRRVPRVWAGQRGRKREKAYSRLITTP
jgi:hypothetical protein